MNVQMVALGSLSMCLSKLLNTKMPLANYLTCAQIDKEAVFDSNQKEARRRWRVLYAWLLRA